MAYRIFNPPDESIVWCIQLCDSHPQRCLQYLRASYPNSRIVLLADGDTYNVQEYEKLALEFRAQLIIGEHLMAFETCDQYVTRLLQQILTGPEQYLLRIDPDTHVWRRFSWLPEIDCAFGTLETMSVAFRDRILHPPNIQGGCIGLTREVIKSILDSGSLSYERCVTHAKTGWARSKDCEYIISKDLMLDDFIISWAVDAAGFPIIQHPEIACYWKHAVPNPTLNFAVTHPHKDMEKS